VTRVLAGLAMIGGAVLLWRRSPLDEVPRSLWNAINKSRSNARIRATEQLDCRLAFESLSNGFRQLLRANALADDDEIERIEQQISLMDETAELLDAICEGQPS